jgi:hypothetical protein
MRAIHEWANENDNRRLYTQERHLNKTKTNSPLGRSGV